MLDLRRIGRGHDLSQINFISYHNLSISLYIISILQYLEGHHLFSGQQYDFRKDRLAGNLLVYLTSLGTGG